MMKTKSKFLSLLLAVMLCVTAFSIPASAMADPDADSTPVVDGIVDTEDTAETATGGIESDPTPFTPEGNLTLVDDITQSETNADGESGYKQFITVQSKNGNYFYIIIDHCGDDENVYFLNLVDEADLLTLMDEEDVAALTAVCTCTDHCIAGEVNVSCPVCATDMTKCEGKETVVEPEPDAAGDDAQSGDDTEPTEAESSSSNGLVLIVVLILLGGGAAVYWYKFKKPQKNSKGNTDLDDYDFGDEDEDDEDYEYEPDDDESEEDED